MVWGWVCLVAVMVAREGAAVDGVETPNLPSAAAGPVPAAPVGAAPIPPAPSAAVPAGKRTVVVVEQSYTHLLAVVPMTIIAAFIGLNLWYPEYLVAGGPIAQFLARAIPAFVLQRAAAMENSHVRSCVDWLTGGEVDFEASTGNELPKKRKSRKKPGGEWWAGGTLGKKVAIGARKAAFNWVPAEVVTKEEPKERRWYQQVDVESQGEMSPVVSPPRAPKLTLAEVTKNLTKAPETEELCADRG